MFKNSLKNWKIMIIDKFVAPYISNNAKVNNILTTFSKTFHYASRGRWALYHCLKAYQLENTSILIPAFICPTILEPLKILNIKPIFYDIDINDLNANVCSVQKMITKYPEVKALLVASMYGNPAPMIELETIATTNSILLIDDAAQSFGATLNKRPIGTFGGCGFFSFSPGKPTVAHMGAYFWTNISYEVPYISHKILHIFIYIDFYFNRYKTYTFKKYKIFKLLKILKLSMKIFNIKNDRIEKFEEPILEGVLDQLFKENIEYRTLWLNRISNVVDSHDMYRLVKNTRGIPSPHKLVIISRTSNQTISLLKYLKQQGIYCQLSYAPLTSNYKNLQNLQKLNGCILELPIDPNENKMYYLQNKLEIYMEQKND